MQPTLGRRRIVAVLSHGDGLFRACLDAQAAPEAVVRIVDMLLVFHCVGVCVTDLRTPAA